MPAEYRILVYCVAIKLLKTLYKIIFRELFSFVWLVMSRLSTGSNLPYSGAQNGPGELRNLNQTGTKIAVVQNAAVYKTLYFAANLRIISMRNIISALLVSIAFVGAALAGEAEGTVESVDASTMKLMLADGSEFTIAEGVVLDGIKAGTAVRIMFDDDTKMVSEINPM